MAIEHRETMTVEEYFQLEENDPDTRYEYIDGHVYAMAGGTANHDTIKSNIQRILWNLLRGSKCRVYSSDMKVYISETRYFHPDVIVTCIHAIEEQFKRSNLHALLLKYFPQPQNSHTEPGNSKIIARIPLSKNMSLQIRNLSK